jgi:hypothetical protein
VHTSTGLGYATTIHSAQGVSADTMHGLLTGQESRQQLYTMLTRGGHANHLYLQVVGDGDPHTVIRPDTISPRTPTETLHQIVARDEAPVSASTLLRELNHPAARLFQAVQRYTDGLHVAAEQLVGPQTVAELDHADQLVPGLTTEPAWSSLRAHLLSLAAETGEHPLLHLQIAASGRDLRTAGDMAAVLYWRLPELAPAGPGPVPWLPGIPEKLYEHPAWGDYLAKGPDSWPTSPNKFKITPARTTPSRPGLRREVTQAPPSLAKLRYGGPPTASINGTHDQPEASSSRQPLPCGNSTSTELSPVLVSCRGIRSSEGDGQLALHVITTTTTANARTKHPDGVQEAVRTRPLAPTQSWNLGNEVAPTHLTPVAVTGWTRRSPRSLHHHPTGTQTRSDSDVCRASQVVGRNNRASVTAGQQKPSLGTWRAVIHR